MLSLMAKQREELLQQTSQVMNIPHEVAETPTQVRKTRVSNVNRNIFENNNAIATQKFISSHDLRSAAKGRLRTRNDKIISCSETYGVCRIQIVQSLHRTMPLEWSALSHAWHDEVKQVYNVDTVRVGPF
ncbi:hypothetical protein EJB05_34924, partial [Eragrostis curvula]